MQVSVQQLLGKGYNDGWFTNCDARYRVFEGGRSTKKSVDIGGYEPIFKILTDRNRNIIMCRKDDTNNTTSTYPNIVKLIHELNLQHYFTFKKSPQEIIYRPTGQKIIFKGCNNPTAITSTKFPVGELTDIYFEEASELSSYDDFRQIDGSVRNSTGKGLQITLLMNGWDKKSWIYDVFWKGNLEDDYDYLETHDYMDYYDPEFSLGQDSNGLYLHKSTFRINEFRSPNKDANAEMLKLKAFRIYCVECLGMWGNNTSATYPDFTEEANTKSHQEIINTTHFGAFTIGIDFGMGNGEGKVVKNTKDQPARYRSATNMQLVGYDYDFTKIIPLQEFFYSNENKEIKKGTPELADDMIKTIISWIRLYSFHPILMKGKIVCYVDSADSGGFRTVLEQKAIENGLGNIVFIASTKNKIQSRVDFENLMLQLGDMIICQNNKNLIREFKNARQDEDGRCREDIDDHCLNAFEYAFIPLLPRIRAWQSFKEH